MSYLISLILLLLPTYLIRFSVFGIPTTLLETLIYLIFLYGLGRGIRDGFRPIPAKIWLPIGLLILALIISIIISPDKRTALGEFKGFFLDPILIFWLIWQYLKKEDMPKLFWALIFSGLFVASHTIIKKIFGLVEPDGRVVGIFGYSPNYTALFLAPITVSTVSLLLTDYRLALISNKYLRLALISGLSAIYLLAIYFSGSRGGFLAVAAGLGIFVIAYWWTWIKKRLLAKIIIAVLILVSLYTAWTFFQPDFSVSPEAGRIASSNNIRWQIWQTSLELAKTRPIFGVGLANFQAAFTQMTQERANFPEYISPLALTPHNIFLMFWLSVGLLGLGAFVWLVIKFYQQALLKISSKFTPLLLAIMSTIISYGLIEASIWKNDLSIIFWVIWGLIWII